MNKYIIYLAASLLLITSCGKSPQKAREELTKIGIEFTDEAFNEAITKKDKIAIDLFLDAEHDASFVLADGINTYTKEDNKDINLVQQLIDNSSDFNIRHQIGISHYSALGEAVSSENEEIIKLILKKGADPNFNDGEALRKALLHKNNLNITKMLLKAGADVNIKREGDSLLYSALFRSYYTSQKDKHELDVVQFLLDNGADVNDGEDGNSSSLMYAVSKADKEMTETLLKKGANINTTWQKPNDINSFIFGRSPRKYTLYDMAEGEPEIIAILNKYSKQQNQAKT